MWPHRRYLAVKINLWYKIILKVKLKQTLFAFPKAVQWGPIGVFISLFLAPVPYIWHPSSNPSILISLLILPNFTSINCSSPIRSHTSLFSWMEIKLYVTTIYPSRNKKAINIFDFIISHCNSITVFIWCLSYSRPSSFPPWHIYFLRCRFCVILQFTHRTSKAVNKKTVAVDDVLFVGQIYVVFIYTGCSLGGRYRSSFKTCPSINTVNSLIRNGH